jgi:hypothetical protein
MNQGKSAPGVRPNQLSGRFRVVFPVHLVFSGCSHTLSYSESARVDRDSSWFVRQREYDASAHVTQMGQCSPCL